VRRIDKRDIELHTWREEYRLGAKAIRSNRNSHSPRRKHIATAMCQKSCLSESRIVELSAIGIPQEFNNVDFLRALGVDC
jgi:hypothetical protein